MLIYGLHIKVINIRLLIVNLVGFFHRILEGCVRDGSITSLSKVPPVQIHERGVGQNVVDQELHGQEYRISHITRVVFSEIDPTEVAHSNY